LRHSRSPKLDPEQVVLFFINIIHRFGELNSIITDNGTQFTEKKSSSSVMNTTSGLIGLLWHTPA
jgi:hypothetical protein